MKAAHRNTPREFGHTTKGLRRGARFPMTLLLEVRWTNRTGERFTEETLTEVLNEAGTRIRLHGPVQVGDEILIRNLFNRQGARARVTWVGNGGNHNGHAVGLQFLSPNAQLWSDEFTGG